VGKTLEIISDLNGEEIQHISIYDQTDREILLQHVPDNTINVSTLSPKNVYLEDWYER